MIVISNGTGLPTAMAAVLGNRPDLIGIVDLQFRTISDSLILAIILTMAVSKRKAVEREEEEEEDPDPLADICCHPHHDKDCPCKVSPKILVTSTTHHKLCTWPTISNMWSFRKRGLRL